MTFRIRGQLFLRQARDVGRFLQASSIFLVTAVLVFLTAAAMTWVVASNTGNSAAEGRGGPHRTRIHFPHKLENGTARRLYACLSQLSRRINQFLPSFIRRVWILFPYRREQ